jgi:hypothetical protein
MTTMKGMTAIQAHETLELAAQPRPEVRDCTSFKVGDVFRQGDCYIAKVDDSHARGKARSDRQLAIGNTQGSRHVAEAPALVFEGTTAPPWFDQSRALLGPVLVVPKGETALVSHPEHAHGLLGEGTWQTTHQLDWQSQQRVQD